LQSEVALPMQTKFSRSLKRNLALLDELLLLNATDDIVTREFHAIGQNCALFYVEGMSNGVQMAEHILRPMLGNTQEASGQAVIDFICAHVIEAPEIKVLPDPKSAVQELMRGQCLLLVDTADQVIVVDMRSYVRRSITTPQTESVVIGPHEAFNEVLRDNLTLLHKKLQSPDLVCEIHEIGSKLSTQLALCYLNGICPEQTITELKRRIDGSSVDYVLSGGMLEQLIEDDPFAPLPQVASSERPDRAVSFLLEGQAVLLLDGSPLALAMPMGIWHLFHAPDDSHMRWQYGSYMRLIRFIGAVISLLLPALFVSIVIYHPIALPMTLLTSILQSRTVVPISLLGESVLLLTFFSLINEAGTRVPGLMGSSLGLVSTLILGTAAVDAALVSPLLIIVVALSGLGGYALPDYSLSFAFRIAQMLLLLIGGMMGLVGVCMALVLLVCCVAGMESLGMPYLAPSSPKRTHNPDLILRAPVFRQRLRAYLANPAHMDRAHGRMRRFDEEKEKTP
ncbi:MAG: spore germination protein, partial [Clostridia bacterium]